jgi:PAS domain-containing protein
MGSVARWDDFTKDLPEYAHGAQPRMVMSLIVTPKGNKPNQWRLCHDARPLNKLLLKQKFRMARLEDFLKQLARGDCLFTLDIESAYHHVEVNPRFCTLLGFELDGIFATTEDLAAVGNLPPPGFRVGNLRRMQPFATSES